MSLWKIAWRSIQQRGLSSSLTGLSMALGVALVVAVVVFQGVIQGTFLRSGGYDLILGAKGGRLELVLNTVFHLGQPIENIPWNFYKEFTPEGPTGAGRPGRYSSVVDVAIPYCLGDNYKGFRVIGTTPDLFDRLGYVSPRTNRIVKYSYSAGNGYSHEDYFGAVVGSVVARRLGLKVGDAIEPTHGVTTEEGQGHKHDPFIIRGILNPTGTPNDRAVFVNMEGFYLLEGHAKEEAAGHDDHPQGDHKHDDPKHDDPKHDDPKHEAKSDAAPAGEPKPAEPPSPNKSPSPDDVLKTGDAAPACTTEETEEQQPAGPPPDPAAAQSHAGHDHSHAGHDHSHDHHGHDHHGHDHGHSHSHAPLPENQREVTAILLRTNNPMAPIGLANKINEGNIAQAVAPQREVAKLFDGLVGDLQVILLILAVLIVVVAGIGIMVSIYNSMSERRREIAVMRALGASQQTVMSVVLLESILLSLVGGLAGFVLGHGLIGLLSPYVASQTGVPIGFLQFVPTELVLIPGIVVLATLAGFLPATAAYRTDVSRALSATP